METTELGGRTVKLTGRELRWLADHYEQNQRLRIETGERLRAVLQGRDETFVPVGWVVTREALEQLSENGTGPGGDLPPEVWDLAGGALAEHEDEDAAWVTPEVDRAMVAEAVLDAVAKGDTRGPVPMLGRAYRRHAAEETETRRDMEAVLQAHPAWPWLEAVKGVGPTLAAKILSRVDATQAPYCSSYWKYCGLATVPGQQYECDACGLVRGWPVGYNVSGKHEALNHVPTLVRLDAGDGDARRRRLPEETDAGLEEALTELVDDVPPELLPDDTDELVEALDAEYELLASALRGLKRGEERTVDGRLFRWTLRGGWRSGGRCPELLEATLGPEDGIRVAQPKPKRGEPASYDQYAKKVCWQIATSIIKTGARTDSAYERYYRREYAKALAENPGWRKGRVEAKARRKMEKLFLAHLWELERTERGLPTPDPYVMEHGDGQHTKVGPWEFIEDPDRVLG